jgi:hypothetical protein
VVGVSQLNASWVDPLQSEVWANEEDPTAYQVLAFDPGGTTGWAIFCVHPDAMEGDPEIPIAPNIEWWTAGQFTGGIHEQADEMVELVASWPSARLVTESFKLRQAHAELSPVELNAIVSWAVRPRYFVFQNPALAMGMVTDDRQKDWGFWIPGKEHARDAVKHGLTFLKRRKEQAVAAARRSNAA